MLRKFCKRKNTKASIESFQTVKSSKLSPQKGEKLHRIGPLLVATDVEMLFELHLINIFIASTEERDRE